MNHSLHEFIANYGLWAVLVGTFLEGESVVVLAGFLSHQRVMHLHYVMLVAFAGSFLADQLLFLLGRRYRNTKLVQRAIAQPAFARAMQAVEKYPHGFILSLRFLYGLRTVGPIALGVSSVPPMRYFILNGIAAVIWAVCFSWLGYAFGQTIESLLGRIHGIESKLAIGLGAAAVIFILHRWWAARANRPRDSSHVDAKSRQ